MLVGVPREIKDHEYRVGLTPAGVHALCERGHQVCVETGAGARIGFPDGDYMFAGARMVASAKEVFTADMVVKVKELQPAEFSLAAPFPNPFNSAATIEFSLPAVREARLGLWDLSGRMVRVLAQGSYSAGIHRMTLEAGSLPSGLYILRLEAAGESAQRKILLMK